MKQTQFSSRQVMKSQLSSYLRLCGRRHPTVLAAVSSSSLGLTRRFSRNLVGCSTPSLGCIANAGHIISRRSVSSTPSRLGQEAAAVAVPEPESPGQPLAGPDNFWRRIPIWKDVSTDQFMSWDWNKKNVVEYHGRSRDEPLKALLMSLVPDFVLLDGSDSETQSREDFIEDVFAGLKAVTMSMRLMPHTFSRIDWDNPRNDPIFRQFIPLQSRLLPDHPKNQLDSLHENADSPVDGLVHRYPDKALFLPISVCPTYCAFCTRSYAVGAETELYDKQAMKPTLKRWNRVFDYVASQPGLVDIVVSGGDSYYLTPEQVAFIGERLIGMPNIKKIRFASKGLAVCPNRIIDPKDRWTDALVYVHEQAKKAGKRVALHTHFNHPNEISWVTELASKRLINAGVTVRNQTVLLRGVNDSVETMGTLIRKLAETLRIQPYYVYQCDMVPRAEHFRTPLQKILDMETQLRGSIAGFDMPQFVVDLPGGGGKRLACSYESYDGDRGISKYIAPAIKGESKEDKVYEYYDPVKASDRSLPFHIGG